MRSASVLLMPTRPLGLPSIRMRTFWLPRRLTFPSTSTLTLGTLSSTSAAVPPRTLMSLSTLNTRLSSWSSIWRRSPTTSTSSMAMPPGRSTTVPRSVKPCCTVAATRCSVKPRKLTFTA